MVATSHHASASALGGTVERDEVFIKRFRFRFPAPRDPFLAWVPVGEILRSTGANAIISEFGLKISSTYELIARRRFGGPRFAFWTHGFNAARGETRGTDRLVQHLS